MEEYERLASDVSKITNFFFISLHGLEILFLKVIKKQN